MIEEWRPIQGYEGLYSVSNLGNIKSHSKKSGFLTLKEKIVHPYIKGNGYLQIDLTTNGNKKKCYVHRLVAQAFIPNPNNLETINHKDKNRTNNRVDNLEWMSYSDNNKHGECQIKAGKAKRIPIYQCNLNGDIIKEWNCALTAAKELGFTLACIRQCCKGRLKTYKGFIWKDK